MKANTYKFSSYLSNIVLFIVTCFLALMTFIASLWADEKKLF